MLTLNQDNREIPEDMLNQLISSRNANAGYSNLRQIVAAIFDQVRLRLSLDFERVMIRLDYYIMTNLTTVTSSCFSQPIKIIISLVREGATQAELGRKASKLNQEVYFLL